VRQTPLWRHEWVPRNMAAAVVKAKGSHERARDLLDEARERRLERARGRGDAVFVSPHPVHQAAAAERVAWSNKSDDQLAEAMAGADDATLETITAELDRRDQRARKSEAQRIRRAEQRRARDAARESAFDDALAAGEDPEQAYARLWGVDAERVRRDEAVASLRSSGYRGSGFRELVRDAFAGEVELSYTNAEDVCRGVLLNKAGRGRNVSARSLFTGPEARARKYASRELLDYWQEHGRMTVEDYTASLIGGAMRSASTAAWS
jgi:hypothetical protein